MKSSSATTDYRDILLILRKKNFKPNSSVERQVAAHVRTLIEKKKLAPHVRLPPIRTLAELWDTNYFTVQAALSRLVGEGLIVQSPKKGSFVAPPRRALRRACLYHDQNLSEDWQKEFYSLLNITLYRILSIRGVITVPFFDHRPVEKQHTAPVEIRDMARDGEIDAVIATSIAHSALPWLQKLEVPAASLMLPTPQTVIRLDYLQMARMAIDEAVLLKRKRMGLIHISMPVKARPSQDLLLSELERLGKENGIEILSPTAYEPAPPNHWEQVGADQCDKLLQGGVRPDILFVYPDTYIRGVATSLLRHHIRVPEDVALVSHRNKESSIYLPFPVTWLTVKIEDFAQGLIKQIDRQITGEPQEPVSIPFAIERSGPSI
ncbi:MAG: substrate-binding domain-containing protein [Candidatus Methylacidiphilales bacterium]|nr:substrate-binding domain-containing protein [Candidatus Methylacidiphilales bacterium]